MKPGSSTKRFGIYYRKATVSRRLSNTRVALVASECEACDESVYSVGEGAE